MLTRSGHANLLAADVFPAIKLQMIDILAGFDSCFLASLSGA